MIIVHIESGLGNQMLSYCEYLALRRMNPDQDIYLETIVYEIPECGEFICQWNGYELEKIFGIKSPPNLKSLFDEKEWAEIIDEIKQTEFWLHNWNYPVSFTKVFNKHGLQVDNIRGDFDPNNSIIGTGYQQQKTLKDRIKDTRLWITIRRYYKTLCASSYIERKNQRSVLFYQSNRGFFTGQWLAFKLRGNNRSLIDDEIKNIFVFPEICDTQNAEMMELLSSCNSVAIHARRGDMANGLAWCYHYGYFRRAVKYIRKHVKNPVFVFFTDPGSIKWCKDNEKVFGLNFSKDNVIFVDWNKGDCSYIDMQLISCCKHAIVTESSFGWWGAYLIKNPNKITFSPSIEIDTTNHC